MKYNNLNIYCTSAGRRLTSKPVHRSLRRCAGYGIEVMWASVRRRFTIEQSRKRRSADVFCRSTVAGHTYAGFGVLGYWLIGVLQTRLSAIGRYALACFRKRLAYVVPISHHY